MEGHEYQISGEVQDQDHNSYPIVNSKFLVVKKEFPIIVPSFDLSTIIIKSDSDELALDGIVIPNPARITAVLYWRTGDATVDCSSYDLPDTGKINLMTMFPG